jgi:hypothetical protein
VESHVSSGSPSSQLYYANLSPLLDGLIVSKNHVSGHIGKNVPTDMGW